MEEIKEDGPDVENQARQRRVAIGEPWNGPIHVEVLQASIAARLVFTVVTALCAVALGAATLGEPGLASEALNLVRDLVLIAVGALLRPRGS